MKNFLLIFFITIITSSVCYAEQIVPAGQCFAEQIRKERATVANALFLSEEQAKQRYELVTKNAPILDEKFRTLYKKNAELKALEAQKATKNDIRQKQKEINAAKKDIKNFISQENKDFKKILNHEQRSKLRMIQKLQRKSMKQKPKDYYKSNPKMKKFGIPKKV